MKNLINQKHNTELLDVLKQSLNLEINEALIENEIKYINEYLNEKEYSNKNNKSRLEILEKDKEISELIKA